MAQIWMNGVMKKKEEVQTLIFTLQIAMITRVVLTVIIIDDNTKNLLNMVI